MKILLKIVLPLLIIAVSLYVYINYSNNAHANYEGYYESEYGLQEITLTNIDKNKLKIVGTGILPGPGNMADEEAVEANTTNIDGEIEMNGNKGVYTDSQNKDCKLYFEFDEKGGFGVNDGEGDNCSVLVDNFTGNYSKVEKTENEQSTVGSCKQDSDCKETEICYMKVKQSEGSCIGKTDQSIATTTQKVKVSEDLNKKTETKTSISTDLSAEDKKLAIESKVRMFEILSSKDTVKIRAYLEEGAKASGDPKQMNDISNMSDKNLLFFTNLIVGVGFQSMKNPQDIRNVLNSDKTTWIKNIEKGHEHVKMTIDIDSSEENTILEAFKFGEVWY